MNEVFFCSACTVSNQRPRITFNSEGVCNACTYQARKRNQIDWAQREIELEAVLENHRDGPGEFDVVVPCSGGKDGGYVAHQLKHNYGMRVLTATWAPLRPTEIGRKNLDRFVAAGFDHVLGTPNPEVTRRLCKFALERIGDPFQPFIFGQTNFPLSIAKKFGATLVMYGENGEVEYGGDQTFADSPVKRMDAAAKHYFSGLTLDEISEAGFSASELSYFQRPTIETGEITQHFFGYYKFWDPQQNYYYANEHLGFEANPERTESTYSRYASLDDKFDGFHYYLAYLKFGIGRATSDSAHEIRDGKISREEGISLVRQFDHEFPAKYLAEFLEYLDISEEGLTEILNSWRSPALWDRQGEVWNLKHAIYY